MDKNGTMADIRLLIKTLKERSTERGFDTIYTAIQSIKNLNQQVLFAIVYDYIDKNKKRNYSIIKTPFKKLNNKSLLNKNSTRDYNYYLNEDLKNFFDNNIIQKKWTLLSYKCKNNYTDIDNIRCIRIDSLKTKKHNYLELIPKIHTFKNNRLSNIKIGDIIFTLQEPDSNDSFIWYKFENTRNFLDKLIFNTNTYFRRGSIISSTASNTGSKTESIRESNTESNRGSRSSNGGTKKLISSKKPKSSKKNSDKKSVKKNTKK